ncbi:hypothetical protein [Burkholderia gladioli]|uniref:hypothetical protein n=1 Tax=Burkholderia gladioli TaxID=28095 RepID=UPI0034DB5AD6
MGTHIFWRTIFAAFLCIGGALPIVIGAASRDASLQHALMIIIPMMMISAGSFEAGRILESIHHLKDPGALVAENIGTPSGTPSEDAPEALPAEPIIAAPTQASEPPSDRREREWGDDELLDLLAEYEREEISQEALGERRALSGRRIGQLLKRAREIRAADARAGIPRSTNSGTA